MDGKSLAYMFSHPACLSAPPGLNTVIGQNAGSREFDCLFIHDVAVLASHRGRGIGSKFINLAINAALARGLSVIAGVSVQGSHRFLTPRHFQPVLGPEATLHFIRESYGPDAYYMVRYLANIAQDKSQEESTA